MTENIIIAIITVIGSGLATWGINKWKTKALEDKVTELYNRIFELEEANRRKDIKIKHLEEQIEIRDERIRALERRAGTRPLGDKT